MIIFKKVKKTENNRSLHQSNQCTVIQSYLCCHPQCRVGPNQKFRIRHDRILSIRRISDFGKSIGFRRIRNPSHPYFTLNTARLTKLGTEKDTRHWWSSDKDERIEEVVSTVFKKQSTEILATELEIRHTLM